MEQRLRNSTVVSQIVDPVCRLQWGGPEEARGVQEFLSHCSALNAWLSWESASGLLSPQSLHPHKPSTYPSLGPWPLLPWQGGL